MQQLERVLGKAEVSGEIGEQLDGAKEAAEHEVHDRKGRQAGFQLGAKAVASLLPHVDKDFEEEKFEGLEPNEVRAVVKKYLVRATEGLENLFKQAKAEEMVAHGKQAAMKTAVTIVQRYHDSAVSRQAQLTAPPEPDDGESENEGKERRRGRRPGEHPGRSPLDARRQETKGQNGKAPTKKRPTKKRATKKRAAKKAPKKGV